MRNCSNAKLLKCETARVQIQSAHENFWTEHDSGILGTPVCRQYARFESFQTSSELVWHVLRGKWPLITYPGYSAIVRGIAQFETHQCNWSGGSVWSVEYPLQKGRYGEVQIGLKVSSLFSRKGRIHMTVQRFWIRMHSRFMQGWLGWKFDISKEVQNGDNLLTPEENRSTTVPTKRCISSQSIQKKFVTHETHRLTK